MGLFKTTMQSLSDLALQENGTVIPQSASATIIDEMVAELEMMPSLTESEMVLPAGAVPVRESKRLGRMLVESDDLAKYMISNGIENLVEALGNIAEANGITFTTDNLAIVIDEDAVMQEAVDLGYNIGGASSNEGNIGTVGLLGPHTDINKFRRFANSKEMIDTITNKYGIPIVKKSYKVGLATEKRGDIHHNGNKAALTEDTSETAGLNAKPGDQVLQEPDNKVDDASKPNAKDDMSDGGNSGSSSGQNKITEDSRESYLQYILDVAHGKYDDQL